MVCSEKQLSVHKDKRNGTWYVKHLNQTKRGFSSKKDAENYEAKLITGIETPKRRNVLKFSEIASDYLMFKKCEIQYSSYLKNKELVMLHIMPYVSDKNIDRFTEYDCRVFRERISKTKFSTPFKNNILNHFKAIFRHAQKYYGLTTNPAQMITPFKKGFEEKIKKKKKEELVWNYDEFGKFIKFVQEEDYKMLFIVLFFTGLRLGEALSLTWLDLKDHKLSITKSVSKVAENGFYEVKETKNVSSIRDVSLNDSLNSLLLDFKKRESTKEGFSDSWFMFGGTKPLSRTSITRKKDNAVEASGVKRITIHQFRHSHATNLINDGVNVVAVSRRLGHSDVSMTLRIYTHLFQKIDTELVENLEESSQILLKNLLTGTFLE